MGGQEAPGDWRYSREIGGCKERCKAAGREDCELLVPWDYSISDPETRGSFGWIFYGCSLHWNAFAVAARQGM